MRLASPWLAFVLAAAATPCCGRSDKVPRVNNPKGGCSNVSGTARDGATPSLPRTAFDDERTVAERETLVRGIERYERLSERVSRALRAVPRHEFVPPGARDRAYEDGPLPIGLGQTISQPTVVAMMSEALELGGDEVVLEVGTGSGYQAAVLSHLCKQVETIEILETLGRRAKETLARLGYANVRVHIGDGYEGLPELAPFDAVIITAAPLDVPPKLIAQLREGGRLVVPVGPQYGAQDLLRIEKRQGGLHRRNLGPVRFVPMVHKDGGP
jgi:protein-L-isoaspartate(D-aspartate) O-methyltransferase